MNRLSQETAEKICSLAFRFSSVSEFLKYNRVTVGYHTIYRDFPINDLLCSIMVYDTTYSKVTHGPSPTGIHMNIFKNGDVFARKFPYYDGALEIIPIYNQRQIFDIANLEINQDNRS